MRILVFLFCFLPAMLWSQSLKNSIQGTWLLHQTRINEIPATQDLTERITFYDEGIIISYLDSANNVSRASHHVYRFLSDSSFIRLYGTDTLRTYLSSQFAPHNIYTILHVSDSLLELITSEGAVPIHLTYRRTQTENINLALQKIINPFIKKATPVIKTSLLLTNTLDTIQKREIGTGWTCEIHTGGESISSSEWFIYSGKIWKYDDTTAAINFDSKYFYAWSEIDQTWMTIYEYHTGNDTIEYIPISSISLIITDTPKRDNRRSAAGGFFLSGGLTTMLLIAPLVGIDVRNLANWREQRYYKTVVSGASIASLGTILMIVNKKHHYKIRPLGTGETNKKWWKIK